jgi:hypothetical protein
MVGTMDADSPSNSRSRSIWFLMLGGNSGSTLSDARSRSPIFREVARLCVWSISMRLCIGGPSVPVIGSKPKVSNPCPRPPRRPSLMAWKMRPPPLAICASACFLNSGSEKDLWLSATCAVVGNGERRSRNLKSRRWLSFRPHIRRAPTNIPHRRNLFGLRLQVRTPVPPNRLHHARKCVLFHFLERKKHTGGLFPPRRILKSKGQGE